VGKPPNPQKNTILKLRCRVWLSVWPLAFPFHQLRHPHWSPHHLFLEREASGSRSHFFTDHLHACPSPAPPPDLLASQYNCCFECFSSHTPILCYRPSPTPFSAPVTPDFCVRVGLVWAISPPRNAIAARETSPRALLSRFP